MEEKIWKQILKIALRMPYHGSMKTKLCANSKKSQLMYVGKDLGHNLNPFLPDYEIQESEKL